MNLRSCTTLSFQPIRKYLDIPTGGLAFPKKSNQKMNKNIKEIAEMLGFTREVEVMQYCGKKPIYKTAPLCEVIGTHAARRTFVVHAMEQGMSPEMVTNQMYDAILGIEPFKSFKEYFNVYQLTLVSKNEDPVIGETALGISSDYGGFSFPYDELEKTKQMLQELFPSIDLNRLTISIATKSKSAEFAGSALWYNSPSNDLSASGLGIGITHYEPGLESFPGTVQHEVCGHAFGKLADEYVIGVGEVLPDELRQVIVDSHENDWMVNIDITSNPEEIIWKHFLDESAYAGADIGIFEGGYMYYGSGVWRPSDDSIMRHSSSDEFNGPSREILYMSCVRTLVD